MTTLHMRPVFPRCPRLQLRNPRYYRGNRRPRTTSTDWSSRSWSRKRWPWRTVLGQGQTLRRTGHRKWACIHLGQGQTLRRQIQTPAKREAEQDPSLLRAELEMMTLSQALQLLLIPVRFRRTSTPTRVFLGWGKIRTKNDPFLGNEWLLRASHRHRQMPKD